MPSPPPVVYCFEGDTPAEVNWPAAYNVLPGWERQLPTDLYQAGTERLRFVGVLWVGAGLLVVLPKYLRERKLTEWNEPGCSRAEEARRVLAVLYRYGRWTTARHAEEANLTEPEFLAGEPAIALALLDDYQTYGYWQEAQRELTIWPGARPDWPRTVSRTQPILSGSGALYPVRYGYRQPPDAGFSLLEQLHRWAVRYCLTTYQAVLPGLETIGHDPDAATDLVELGESDYLSAVVEQARHRVFRDSQLHTLSLLTALLNEQASASVSPAVRLFGTTAFQYVWEQVCKDAFADRSATLPAPLPIPTWRPWPTNSPAYQNARHRLIPDIVWYDAATLLLADAKYYSVVFRPDGQLLGAPGMPDLIKQVVYEQALLPSLRAAGYALGQAHNVFLLPAARPPLVDENSSHWHWGYAYPNIPGWEQRRVAVWLIPPACLFAAYLTGRQLSWQSAIPPAGQG